MHKILIVIMVLITSKVWGEINTIYCDIEKVCGKDQPCMAVEDGGFNLRFNEKKVSAKDGPCEPSSDKYVFKHITNKVNDSSIMLACSLSDKDDKFTGTTYQLSINRYTGQFWELLIHKSGSATKYFGSCSLAKQKF